MEISNMFSTKICSNFSSKIVWYGEFFLEFAYWFFLIYSLGLGVHVGLCMAGPNVLGEIVSETKWSKMVESGSKMGFFIYFEKVLLLIFVKNIQYKN